MIYEADRPAGRQAGKVFVVRRYGRQLKIAGGVSRSSRSASAAIWPPRASRPRARADARPGTHETLGLRVGCVMETSLSVGSSVS